MQKNLISALLLILFITFNACTRKEGDWDDNIQLSLKTAEFSALGDSVTVKTGGDWWWIYNISVNDTYYRGSTDSTYTLESYVVQHDCFVVERKDKNTLFIKVDENTTHEVRVIKVQLEAGDYFDRVTITQKAK